MASSMILRFQPFGLVEIECPYSVRTKTPLEVGSWQISGSTPVECLHTVLLPGILYLIDDVLIFTERVRYQAGQHP